MTTHEHENEIKIYGWETILAVAIIGGILVALAFAYMWDQGVIAETWSAWRRWLCVLVALIYGGVLGWMIYPRGPLAWIFGTDPLWSSDNDRISG